jgi:hypothetical protein
LIQETLTGGGAKAPVVLDCGSDALKNFNVQLKEKEDEIAGLEETNTE